MIENVENFRAKLNVESLGNLLDVVVLEHGEVQRSQAGTCDDIAAGIAAQIEASQISWRKGPPKTRWRWIAVRVKECLIWCHGNLETFGFNIVIDIAGTRKRLATGAA